MSDCGVCLYSDASDCEGQIDSASIVTLDEVEGVEGVNEIKRSPLSVRRSTLLPKLAGTGEVWLS
jgi:hypothetical protein